MHNACFQNANKVFVGVLCTNKAKGLDKCKPKIPISKPDLEKLYDNYMLPGVERGDTKVLQHKVFFDLVYLMGRRGKEGLRKLQKDWFYIGTDDTGTEYVEIIVNEKTKNQGDSLSTSSTLVYDDNNLMFGTAGSLRCAVASFRKYMSLLNPKISAFFQHPSKDRTWYDAQVIGKNPIGHWIALLSKRAGLSKIYSNHEIRKTCTTGMKKGGVPIPDIAHHLKHKDIQTLQHYLEKPTIEDKRRNAKALHNYTVSNPEEIVPEEPNNAPQLALQPAPNQQMQVEFQALQEKENVTPQNAIIPFDSNLEVAQPVQATPIQNNSQVVKNQLKQAPMLFSGATFNNCTINLNVPQ